jgi:hypothetical protein
MNKILLLIKIFILTAILLPNSQVLLAQTACDPNSMDTDQILNCGLGGDIPAKTYDPGTDPSNPATFPFSGIGGIASAYSDKTDSLLVVGHQIASNGSRQILAVLANPKTLAVKSQAIRVDSNGTAGSPMVVYSSDLEKFFVVWEDTRCNSCRNTYGRFVSADGKLEGTTDFSINNGAAFLSGVAYDPTNKLFVVAYDNGGSSIAFRTVDDQGKVSNATTVISSYDYQGQGDVTVNTNLNEYWFSYTEATGVDAKTEDSRAMVSRFDAKTLKPIGKPIQLSVPRIGHNTFGQTKIDYSPNGGAMVMWLERGREGIAGMWGRAISDSGILSDEFPVITVGTNIYSDGFSSNTIKYNPWTETFFVFSGDWNGNAWVTEIDLGGLIYSNEPAIGLMALDNGNSWWQKLSAVFIKKALAAVGSFNVTGAVTPFGASTFASRNYNTVVGTSYSSVNAPINNPSPANPVPQIPNPTDVKKLPTLVSQIYIWSLGIGVLLALLMSILGGYYYMTSGGNAEQASKGKEFITGALLGLAILFGAYLLLNQINPDLVNFNLNSLKSL